MKQNDEFNNKDDRQLIETYTFNKGIPGFEHLKLFNLQQHDEVFSLLVLWKNQRLLLLQLIRLIFIVIMSLNCHRSVLRNFKLQIKIKFWSDAL